LPILKKEMADLFFLRADLLYKGEHWAKMAKWHRNYVADV